MQQAFSRHVMLPLNGDRPREDRNPDLDLARDATRASTLNAILPGTVISQARSMGKYCIWNAFSLFLFFMRYFCRRVHFLCVPACRPWEGRKGEWADQAQCPGNSEIFFIVVVAVLCLEMGHQKYQYEIPT